LPGDAHDLGVKFRDDDVLDRRMLEQFLGGSAVAPPTMNALRGYSCASAATCTIFS